MSTQDFVTCDCGERNASYAFRCGKCGKIFDGGLGNTIPTRRMVTVPERASATVQAESAAMPMPIRQRVPALGRGRDDMLVEIVTFDDHAHVRVSPCPVNMVSPFTLHPGGSTNEADGLRLAGEEAGRHCPNARLNLILFGDGEPTSGGRWHKSDADAALEEAEKLKRRGARIATIGFEGGGSMDFHHLRQLASSPSLALEARSGRLTAAFLNVTHTLTQDRWDHQGPELVAFVIDESGSMNEGTKKEELEEAVRSSLAFLGQL
jgi:uncharacterized protein YegL